MKGSGERGRGTKEENRRRKRRGGGGGVRVGSGGFGWRLWVVVDGGRWMAGVFAKRGRAMVVASVSSAVASDEITGLLEANEPASSSKKSKVSRDVFAKKLKAMG